MASFQHLGWYPVSISFLYRLKNLFFIVLKAFWIIKNDILSGPAAFFIELVKIAFFISSSASSGHSHVGSAI